MSIGNLKTEGNKGNNFPYQLRTLQLLGAIATNTAGGPGIDYETRTTSYEAIAAGAGYAIGDIIVRYDIITMPGGAIAATIWFNQTDQTTIAAPTPADIVPVASSASVTVTNAGGALAVNIQDGGNSITIDNINLDSPLSGILTELQLKADLTETQPVSLATTVRTPSLLRVTGAGAASVAAGARSVSFYNAGSMDTTVAGDTLKKGEQVSFDAGAQGDTLGAISYDALTSELVISKVI